MTPRSPSLLQERLDSLVKNIDMVQLVVLPDELAGSLNRLFKRFAQEPLLEYVRERRWYGGMSPWRSSERNPLLWTPADVVDGAVRLSLVSIGDTLPPVEYRLNPATHEYAFLKSGARRTGFSFAEGRSRGDTFTKRSEYLLLPDALVRKW